MSAVSGIPALRALTRRELIRFVRQPSRIIASLGTPALLWAFLAGGFADSFAPPAGAGGADQMGGASYAAYLLPGMAAAAALFSAIFGAMSLIEDRKAGFLQAALVSPAPAWSTELAKTIGGTIVATAQAALVIAAAPAVGLAPGPLGFILALLAAGLIAGAVVSVGLAAAWWVNSSEGFHGVMNLVLMPLWLLSGAFFPIEGASGWLKSIMLINPLRWPTDAMRAALSGESASAWTWIGSIGFTAAAIAGAIVVIGHRGGNRR